MAKKKTVKKTKVKAKPAAPKAEVKAEKPSVKAEKPSSNIMGIAIMSGVIVVAALVIAIVFSQFHTAQLEKAAAAAVVAAPTVVTQSAPGSIDIKDPNTNKTYKLDIKPASVSQSPAQNPAQAAAAAAVAAKAAQSAAPAAPAAATAPVAAPTSTNIPLRCKVYYKPVDAKANIQRMDIEDAEYLYNSGKALFIDARGPNEYAEAHIKGAINIPVNTTPDQIAKMKDQLDGKLLVTYCHGVGCHLSDKSAYLLFDAGYHKLGIFFGGWPKWNEHKLPIETKAPAPAATAATPAK